MTKTGFNCASALQGDSYSPVASSAIILILPSGNQYNGRLGLFATKNVLFDSPVQSIRFGPADIIGGPWIGPRFEPTKNLAQGTDAKYFLTIKRNRAVNFRNISLQD